MRRTIMTLFLLLLLTAPLSAAAERHELPHGGEGVPYAIESDPGLPEQDRAALSGTAVPGWTYEMRNYAFLRVPVFSRADPVNIVFCLPLSTVRSQLSRAGWNETSKWNILEANVNFLPYRGFMWPQSANFFLDSYNGTRYHLRIWCLGNQVIGQAHIDTTIPHRAYCYESAEARVARAFYRFCVRRNSLCLHNACYDGQGYYSNGWATVIKQ